MKKNREHLLEYVRINHYFETGVEMAAALGISSTTMTGLCNELGVKPISPLDRKVEHIIMANKKGVSIAQMAADLDTSMSYVDKIAREHGIKIANQLQTLEGDKPPEPKKDDLVIAKEKQALREKIFRPDRFFAK